MKSDRAIIVYQSSTDTPPNNCPVCLYCPDVPIEVRPMIHYQKVADLCVGHNLEFIALLRARGLMPQLTSEQEEPVDQP